MHLLVQMYDLARKEFERNLNGLTDADARKRLEPMNCISWIIAHVAWQQHTCFVDWPLGKKSDPRYVPYAPGSPASQPPLDEVMALWRDACNEADIWLQSATSDSLLARFQPGSSEGESGGTLLVRCIFHTWCHLGEISSIRQILGHHPPEFVNMYGWSYDGT
ncbi:MAG: DinB family protein [Dehalococcoidales bacterium]|nr:MAG: DinB family protein [Dehalococcoidales bacterium]